LKCPYCLVYFYEDWRITHFGNDGTGEIWHVARCECSNCRKTIIAVAPARVGCPSYENLVLNATKPLRVVQPKDVARAPLSKEVPERFSCDYMEACVVLADSPKASAALSRRCLQHLLREVSKVKPGNLSDEIDEVMKSLPSHLAKAIDAIRNIGNFAAHPMKSTNSGEIIDVELGEAEWLLDVLEGLFDFYFVQPAILEQKRQTLNAKLKDAGKPELK
jgi:hypothetical protein